MPLKAGDRIVIRDWDDMAAEYEIDSDGDICIPEYDTYFTNNMRKLCGAHGVIDNIDDDDWIYLSLDDEELNEFADCFHFFRPMLRLEDDIVDIEISEAEFNSLLEEMM